MSAEPEYVYGAAKAVAVSISGKLPEVGHTHSRAILAQVEAVGNSAQALAALIAARSPLDTAAGFQLKVGQAARRFGEQVATVRDRIHEKLRVGLNDLETRVRDKTGLKADGYEKEVRAAVLAMPLDAKFAYLLDAAKAGRGSELAAVLDAPALLTGIPVDQKQRVRDHLEQHHTPAEKAEREALMNDFRSAFDLLTMAANTAATLSDPYRLAEIERGDAAAADAAKAFAEATGN